MGRGRGAASSFILGIVAQARVKGQVHVGDQSVSFAFLNVF